jgi:hypothetical protein
MAALKTPRFEDYDYTYLSHLQFAYLGNGLTDKDLDPEADKASYLDERIIEP